MSTSTVALCETPPVGGGSTPQVVAAVDELRGAGVPAAKSVGLASASVHPSPARTAAVVLPSAGAAPLPSWSAAVPYPIRSAIEVTAEQLPGDAPQASGVESRTTATLPPETARFVVPVASGVGRGDPTAAADASWTR